MATLAYRGAYLHLNPFSYVPALYRWDLAKFAFRAIGTDPFPDIFSRGRASRNSASLQTIDMDDPYLDAWVRELFARLSRSSDGPGGV